VTGTSTDIYRIADGKIAEQRFESDFTGTMQQLGVIPTPGQACSPVPSGDRVSLRRRGRAPASLFKDSVVSRAGNDRSP
jgi:hypothetical protein